jgi:hypothetical protein
LIYQEGQLELLGGTSASSPSFAGLMAIVDQYTGGRNGNPNPRLYAIASQYPAVFHDVITGSNAVPCSGGSPNCSSSTVGVVGTMNGYSAGVGYDLATGLGSVDAYALAAKWGTTAPAAPSITSLSPNPMTASASNQTLTIYGSGFVSGATVHVSYPGFAGTLAITALTSTQIQASINTGSTAWNWLVQVVNPNNAASNIATLTVNASVPVPSITSLTPNPMTGSASAQILTINGSNFAAGDKVEMTYYGGPLTTLTPTSVTASQIQVSINVGTTARLWSIAVVNASGVQSNVPLLTVSAPAVTTPVIASLNPSSLSGLNGYQLFTVDGSGFASGDSVLATYYGGAMLSLPIASVSGTQIQASINTGTTPRLWSVAVVTPNNVLSNVVLLTVTTGSSPTTASVSNVLATNTAPRR